MRRTRFSITAVVVLLGFALLDDLSAVTVGGLTTADAYYLPLRSVPVGAHRDEIERSLIRTHARFLARQHKLSLLIHGLAFTLSLPPLIAAWNRPEA